MWTVSVFACYHYVRDGSADGGRGECLDALGFGDALGTEQLLSCRPHWPATACSISFSFIHALCYLPLTAPYTYPYTAYLPYFRKSDRYTHVAGLSSITRKAVASHFLALFSISAMAARQLWDGKLAADTQSHLCRVFAMPVVVCGVTFT